MIKKPFSLKELSEMLPIIREEYDKRKKATNTNVLPKAHLGFGQVCDHPQFKESPLATIREHLTNNFANTKNSTLQQKVEKSYRKNLQSNEPNEMNVENTKGSAGKGKQATGGNRGSNSGRPGGNKASKQQSGKGKK